MDLSIVSLFSEKLNKEIEKLRRDISKLGPKEAMDWPIHLTLRDPFDVPENKINDFILGFKKFIKDIRPLQITLDGFQFIENISKDPWSKSDFLISINIERSKELLDLNAKLNQFRLFSGQSDTEFNPHITLASANDLDQDSYNRIKKYLKDKQFNKTIRLNNITFILNKIDKHIIYKRLKI